MLRPLSLTVKTFRHATFTAVLEFIEVLYIEPSDATRNWEPRVIGPNEGDTYLSQLRTTLVGYVKGFAETRRARFTGCREKWI